MKKLIIFLILLISANAYAGFGGYLQANTAVDVLIGPFVDDSDGVTTEEGLTISQGDVLLSKNGQALAQKNDADAATHDDNGYYNCELDTTDTNTEGTLTVTINESGALPVRVDFVVVAQAAYASLVTAKDTGYMDVNVKAVSEDTTAADNAELAFDTTGYGFTGCTMPTVTTLTGHTVQTGDSYAIVNGDHGLVSIQDDVDEILTDTSTTLDNYVDDLETRISFVIPGDTTAVAADVIEYEGNDDVTSQVTAALAAMVIEGAITVDQAMQVMLAFTAGETNGGGTTTINFRDQADSKNRIQMTVDSDGDRSATVLDLD